MGLKWAILRDIDRQVYSDFGLFHVWNLPKKYFKNIKVLISGNSCDHLKVKVTYSSIWNLLRNRNELKDFRCLWFCVVSCQFWCSVLPMFLSPRILQCLISTLQVSLQYENLFSKGIWQQIKRLQKSFRVEYDQIYSKWYSFTKSD
jgi:hypothetical protein